MVDALRQGRALESVPLWTVMWSQWAETIVPVPTGPSQQAASLYSFLLNDFFPYYFCKLLKIYKKTLFYQIKWLDILRETN